MRDKTITLQACNSGTTSNIKGNSAHQSTKTDNMTLQKLSFKEVHEPCSRNDNGPIHEERRLRIEELDEWRAHKPRTHDKPKLHQNKPDTSPTQIKIGDKVLLDAADPHIVTTIPNKEIPLPVLSIFPFGIVEVNTSVGMEKHEHARGKARFYFFDMGVRHARAMKPWTTIYGRDRATSKGSNLYRPLRDVPYQTLWPPQHRGLVISAYTDRSDVPTGHHDYVTHEDDRAPMWDRSSSVPSHSCH
ncbi:hypothetical protein GOBAR_AA08652 [Gossypium barbadense]|uniref:Uncharacterized protein n=1 Tax=Gossypium barbadense TaxID=3634 RepID=A0A2P5Y8R5_GOSBA|nr:hypothetical protein GOBAR_AA08652 [Gossypium barbadense]